jgi:hypothetical protein
MTVTMCKSLVFRWVGGGALRCLFETAASVAVFLFITSLDFIIRGPFAKFVVWRQCAAVIQGEVETVIQSCNGGGNVVVA